MKQLLILLLMLYAGSALAQQKITITGYAVKNALSANVNDWRPGDVNAVAKSGNPHGGDKEVKLVIKVKRGGQVICGNDARSASYENLTTRVISTRDVTAILGDCPLQPGQYRLCMQYFNNVDVGVSDEYCKDFTVESTMRSEETGGITQGREAATPSEPAIAVTPGQPRVQTPKNYRRPYLIAPANNKIFRYGELQKPVSLTWAPVTPAVPAHDLVYTVRIYEILDGQQPTQAARSNQPIFEKEVKTTQAIWQVPAEYTASKEVKSFAWAVQATNKEGKGYGENNGTSEVFMLRMQGEDEIDIKIDTLKVGCCKDGKQRISVIVRNVLTNSNTKVKKLSIVNINGTAANTDISSFCTPTVPYSFLPPGGATTFYADINCIQNINTIVVKAEAERNVNNILLTDNDIEYDTLHCICTMCDKIVMTISEVPLTVAGGNATFTSSVNVTPKPVKQIKTDIVFFSHKPENEDCLLCNTDSRTFGIIADAALADGDFALTSDPYTGEAAWVSNNPAGTSLNGNLTLKVSLPPMVKCCKQKVRLCVRYTFTFNDCTTCEKIVCYSSN